MMELKEYGNGWGHLSTNNAGLAEEMAKKFGFDLNFRGTGKINIIGKVEDLKKTENYYQPWSY